MNALAIARRFPREAGRLRWREGLLALLATGCLFDNHAATRPARFAVGPNLRALDVPTGGGARGTTAGRTSETTPAARDPLSAVSASLKFTMQTSLHTYAGAEIETGRLEGETSSFSGAYGIFGVEQPLGFGSFGVELATGWRGLRYGTGDDEQDLLVIEPRVRGQIWIGEQWTLGGAVGAVAGRGGEWMTGVYLGVHSLRF